MQLHLELQERNKPFVTCWEEDQHVPSARQLSCWSRGKKKYKKNNVENDASLAGVTERTDFIYFRFFFFFFFFFFQFAYRQLFFFHREGYILFIFYFLLIFYFFFFSPPTNLCYIELFA